MASQTKKKPSVANKKTSAGGKGKTQTGGSRQSAKARQAEEERRLMRAGQRDGVLLLIFWRYFCFAWPLCLGRACGAQFKAFCWAYSAGVCFCGSAFWSILRCFYFWRRVQKPQVVRGVQLALFILLLSSALHILGHDTVGMGWAEDLKDAYAQGFGVSGAGPSARCLEEFCSFLAEPCRCNGDLADARRFDAAVLADDCRAFAGAGGKSAVAA